MAIFLMVVGAAVVLFGIWRRLNHAQSGVEHAPTGAGTSPGPFFKVADLATMLIGAVIFLLGAAAYYYSSYSITREEHRGPPAAQTGSLELPDRINGRA
jgi:hypothetical protein